MEEARIAALIVESIRHGFIKFQGAGRPLGPETAIDLIHREPIDYHANRIDIVVEPVGFFIDFRTGPLRHLTGCIEGRKIKPPTEPTELGCREGPLESCEIGLFFDGAISDRDGAFAGTG